MATMTYKQYKESEQKKFNDLPIFYAFSNEQLQQGMEKRWRELGKKGRCPLAENASKYIYSFGAGGFYFKEDAPAIHAWLKRDDPLDELLKDPDFAYSAFYYEMGNHEYHINEYQGNWDVISCFANVDYCQDDWNVESYFKQLDWTDKTKEAYRKARRQFLHDANENDWY